MVGPPTTSAFKQNNADGYGFSIRRGVVRNGFRDFASDVAASVSLLPILFSKATFLFRTSPNSAVSNHPRDLVMHTAVLHS